MASTLEECCQAKADEAKKSGHKLKFTEFDHKYSISIVKSLNRKFKVELDMRAGVCFGLCFTYLGHRHLKDKIASAADDREKEGFVEEYEAIFLGKLMDGALREKLNLKPKKAAPTFSGLIAKGAGRDASRWTHVGVQTSMEVQKSWHVNLMAKSEPFVRREEELARQVEDANRFIGEGGRGHPGPDEEFDARLKESLQAFELMSEVEQADLYERLGGYFLPGLGLLPGTIRGGMPNWHRDKRLSGERHKKTYNFLSVDHHVNVFSLNHEGKSFKFFEPNEGIVSCDNYGIFSSVIKEYIQGEYKQDYSIYTFA